MASDKQRTCRFFSSYSGVRLPPMFVSPIAAETLANRNTYIRAYYDDAGALTGFDKIVYGEVELAHRYHYDDNGVLRRAEIAMIGEDAVALQFGADGARVAQE